MILLLGFAFLAGLVTILTPCIWPLLPIILSSSIAGVGHRRPLGITLGIITSFAIFTLAISAIVRVIHLDPNFLRLVAVIVIVFLGLTMIVPVLSRMTELVISRLTGLFGVRGQVRGSGFVAGFVTGLSLGIVWSPCAGPILAAIATLAASGMVSLTVVGVTLAYVIGAGIPLFVFAYGGQRIFARTRFLSAQTGRIQRVFGVVMLLTALAIYTNYDTYLQAQILNAFPQLSFSGFENSGVVKTQLNILKGRQSLSTVQDTSQLFNVTVPFAAPDFVGITKWLNTSSPISIGGLRGKVVLVDFWTYTCINCIRTLPHLTSWYNKYKDSGFAVIGVHSPEFSFEKDSRNVENAIKQFGILYPVAQDNDLATWNNYSNDVWPAEYLIDSKGFVRRVEKGEGEYDQTEMAIQVLLKEAGKKIDTNLQTMPDQTPKIEISPETYFGTYRMEFYFPNGKVDNGQQVFQLADNLAENSFSFGGSWNVMDQYSTAGVGSELNYRFSAGHVYLVASPDSTGKEGKIKVFLDGKLIDQSESGSDIKNGEITVNRQRLYDVVDLHGKIESHLLKLEFESPVQMYTFTFG